MEDSMKNLFALMIMGLSSVSFAATISLNENTVPVSLMGIKDSHLRVTVAYPGMRACGVRLSTLNGSREFQGLAERITIVNEYDFSVSFPIKVSAEDFNGSLDIDLTALNGAYLGQVGILTKDGQTIAELANALFPNSALMISALPCDL